MVANDFPALDFGLGETADMLRNSVRDFATDEIAPRAAAIDESNEFPSDLWRKMGDLGVLGISRMLSTSDNSAYTTSLPLIIRINRV